MFSLRAQSDTLSDYAGYRAKSQGFYEAAQFDSARIYLRAYREQQDSLLSRRNKAQLSRIQKEYELEKQERELQLLEQKTELEILNAQRDNSAFTLNALFVGMAFVTVAFVAVVVMIRIRLRKKTTLAELEEKRQQEELLFLVRGQQEERAFASAILSNEIVPSLERTGTWVSEMETHLGEDEEDLKMHINAVRLIKEGIEEVKHIAEDIHPVALVKSDLKAAIEEIAEDLNQSGKLRVEVELWGELNTLQMSQQVTVYRILQEVTGNMIRHAKAAVIRISVVLKEGTLLLWLIDDGVGFNAAKIRAGKGLGWDNIRSRIAIFEGEIRVNSERGKGTQVEISMKAVSRKEEISYGN